MGGGQYTNGRHMNVHSHRTSLSEERTVMFLQFGGDLASFLHLWEIQSVSAFDDKLIRIQQCTAECNRTRCPFIRIGTHSAPSSLVTGPSEKVGMVQGHAKKANAEGLEGPPPVAPSFQNARIHNGGPG